MEVVAKKAPVKPVTVESSDSDSSSDSEVEKDKVSKPVAKVLMNKRIIIEFL